MQFSAQKQACYRTAGPISHRAVPYDEFLLVGQSPPLPHGSRRLYMVNPSVGGVAQWQNVGLWPANFPCPALDLQLMGDH